MVLKITTIKTMFYLKVQLSFYQLFKCTGVFTGNFWDAPWLFLKSFSRWALIYWWISRNNSGNNNKNYVQCSMMIILTSQLFKAIIVISWLISVFITRELQGVYYRYTWATHSLLGHFQDFSWISQKAILKIVNYWITEHKIASLNNRILDHHITWSIQ